MKKEKYTAEHLRRIQKLEKGLPYPIVLGYDTVEDELGILHPNSVVFGEGKEWIIYRGELTKAEKLD